MKIFVSIFILLGLSLNLSAFDCVKASTEIKDMYNEGKYKEISKKRLDDKFAWECRDDYEMHIFLGNMHFYKTKNNMKAESFFKAAIQINPNQPVAYLDLAAVKIKYEEYDEAVELCEQMLAKDLDAQSKFLFNAQAGQALYKKGAANDDVSERNPILLESKKYLDKALKLKPTYPTGNLYVANIYKYILKNSAEASKHFKIACENGMQTACGK